MNRGLTAFTLMLGMLLATMASAAAQSEGAPSVESSMATGPEASSLPILTITNSAGEEVPVRVEIADTDAERQTGLMGRTTLAGDTGP